MLADPDRAAGSKIFWQHSSRSVLKLDATLTTTIFLRNSELSGLLLVMFPKHLGFGAAVGTRGLALCEPAGRMG